MSWLALAKVALEAAVEGFQYGRERQAARRAEAEAAKLKYDAAKLYEQSILNHYWTEDRRRTW